MNFNLPLFLQDSGADIMIPTELLNATIKNTVLKDIANILNDLRAALKENLPKDLSTQKEILQYTNELKNFKPTFQNLPTLEKILENISKSLPQNFPKRDKIIENIKTVKTILKNTVLFKNVQQNSILLKNEIQTVIKEIKNEPNIKMFSAKIDNFLKLINNDKNIDTKDLQSAFKEIKEHFNEITKLAHFKNISPFKISSLQKHIDTISTLLNLQHTHTKEVKSLETFLKEMITTHQKNRISLAGKQNLIKSLENITKNIDTISSSLPNEKKYISIKTELKNFTQNIHEVNLEKNIKNSGVFYEAKLFKSDVSDTSIKEFATKDVKAILLKLKSDESLKENHQLNTAIDKTISQINTVQTNALLTQTLFTYIPFGWDNLKEGSLSISNLKKKDNFSCKIELDLENYGQIDILMLFAKEMVSLNMDIKNEKFKNILQAHRFELKKALESIGYDTAIFFGKQKSNRYDLQSEVEADMGMDIKI